MKIKSVKKGSIVSRRNLSPGDELLKINGRSVKDIIDYRFYSADQRLILKLRSRSGKPRTVQVNKEPDEDLGLEFYPIRYRSCTNKCIFCFVHQLPKGLRRALYFKDEDYRLSFLHGNFITLTNTSDEDLERIIRQRLSPLYISVHATDEVLRKRMLGNAEIPDIMPLIRRLAQGKIEMHAQIVLCPGINDGEHLEKSVNDLSAFYPFVKSLALVPVGLTRFRSRLPKIRPIGRTYSGRIMDLVARWQKVFRRKFGTGFVYAADEFFSKAGLGIPPKRYYDEFYQVENGVGMIRQFLDDFRSKQRLLPRRVKKDLRITLVTGVSAFGLINRLINEHLRTISGLKIKVVKVKNAFFGQSVTVTGLLAGTDIKTAVNRERTVGEVILLPPNCVNQDSLFLDDLSPRVLENELGRRVLLASDDLIESLAKLLTQPDSER